VRPYGIGNTILATPAMQLCRYLRPEARLEALLDPLGALTLGAWPLLDQVHLYPDVPLPEDFERVLLLEPASPKVSAPFLRHRGLVKHRLGAWYSARFLRRHEVEVNLEVVAALGGRDHPSFPLYCDVAALPEDVAPAPGTLAVHIGGLQPQQVARRFPTAFWTDLLRPVAAAGAVALVGGAEEAPEAARIADAVGATSLCGALSLPVTAAFIKRCAALVGTDGGLAHVAAAVGTPVVALFSTSNPWKSRPWAPVGRSIVVEVPAVPGGADVRTVRRALALVFDGGPDWLAVRAGKVTLRRSRRWWRR
jgi:ADP-heptose:LPS heptosyltransferase